MEGFFEKLLEVVSQYGIFAVMFTVVLVMLYKKYEGDIARYREREDKFDVQMAKTQENISNNLTAIAGSQERVASILNGIDTKTAILLDRTN
ncbi:MAG: hypothetical protein Q8L68_07825, partial [Methylococcales bacterium]|nr:hypothetical protein [Methylococcales bacterium]